MVETSNCASDDDDDADESPSTLQTEPGPQPLTIMKAR